MVRAPGGPITNRVDPEYPKPKKKEKKGKNKKPTPQQEQDYAEIHAEETDHEREQREWFHGKSPVDGAQGAEQRESEFPIISKKRSLYETIDAMPVVEQTEIEVGDKVGMPPRVRFAWNCVAKKKAESRDENTLVVGVDDMELLFEFFGYPLP